MTEGLQQQHGLVLRLRVIHLENGQVRLRRRTGPATPSRSRRHRSAGAGPRGLLSVSARAGGWSGVLGVAVEEVAGALEVLEQPLVVVRILPVVRDEHANGVLLRHGGSV